MSRVVPQKTHISECLCITCELDKDNAQEIFETLKQDCAGE